MQGNTTIELNQATICEAVQEYLDKRLFKAGTFGKVTYVKQTTDLNVTFRVTLEKGEAPASE